MYDCRFGQTIFIYMYIQRILFVGNSYIEKSKDSELLSSTYESKLEKKDFVGSLTIFTMAMATSKTNLLITKL
jgi:hypothetical protein